MQLSTGKDVSLNLTPFIDLLSCCLAFLLITAVWSQSAQLPASTAGSGEGEAARPFRLHVQKDGCTLTAPDGTSELVDFSALRERLGKVGEDLQVSGGDHLPYDVWIRALDAARSAGVVRLAIAVDG